LKDKLVLLFGNLILFHVFNHPLVELFFGDDAVIVNVTILYCLRYIFLQYWSHISVKSLSNCLFMNLEHNSQELFRLFKVKDAGMIMIILCPNLIDDVANDLLVL
jgi:hypothetical protein